MSQLETKMEDALTQHKKAIRGFAQELTGSKILSIRAMTEEELEASYGDTFGASAYVIELDSGWQIYTQADEENNGPGVLAFYNPKTDVIMNDYDLARFASEGA